MASREQPCAALYGDGQQLELYSDRVVIHNSGVSRWLFGRDERTVFFDEIDDVFLYEDTGANESLLKLSLRHADLSIVLAYPHKQEWVAKGIRDVLDVNIHHEGRNYAHN